MIDGLLVIVEVKIYRVILIIRILNLIVHPNSNLGIMALYQCLLHNKWALILELQWELVLRLVPLHKFSEIIKK
jgi:hypothetical protein